MNGPNDRLSAGCTYSRWGYGRPPFNCPTLPAAPTCRDPGRKRESICATFAKSAARFRVPDSHQIRPCVERATADEEIIEYFASDRSRCDADKGCPLNCVVNNRVEGELKLIARPAIAFGSIRDDRFVFGSGTLLDQTTQNPYHIIVRKFKLVTTGAVFATFSRQYVTLFSRARLLNRCPTCARAKQA